MGQFSTGVKNCTQEAFKQCETGAQSRANQNRSAGGTSPPQQRLSIQMRAHPGNKKKSQICMTGEALEVALALSRSLVQDSQY